MSVYFESDTVKSDCQKKKKKSDCPVQIFSKMVKYFKI